ncbi:hypothetical protein [Burkholderia alba]|uniref:hypothetical protein n=1 Tax=Burkholderia alba TaxID=2683677 RepID=UPI002B051CF7|nr:hypothetical protein [Burkholderia alba]
MAFIDQKARRQHIGLIVACAIGMTFSSMAGAAESDHVNYGSLTSGASAMHAKGTGLQADAFLLPVLGSSGVAGIAGREAGQPMKTALFDLSCDHPWYRMGLLELAVCQPW